MPHLLPPPPGKSRPRPKNKNRPLIVPSPQLAPALLNQLAFLAAINDKPLIPKKNSPKKSPPKKSPPKKSSPKSSPNKKSSPKGIRANGPALLANIFYVIQ